MAKEVSIHSVPIILVIVAVVTVTITYVWSVANGHVSPVFPYISDTGAYPPESCLFTEMANFVALLIAITISLRYMVLRDFANVANLPMFQTLIIVNFILGLLVALGVSFVGNYQSINVSPLHLLGAFIVFGLGASYTIIDVVLSYHTAIFPNQSRSMCHFRAFLAASATFSMVLTITSGVIAERQRVVEFSDPRLRLIWRPQDGGYEAHVVSTVTEWLVSLAELVYFATFIGEFSKFRMSMPQLRPVDPASTLRQGGPSTSNFETEDRESDPLLKTTKSRQLLYIGTGATSTKFL